MLEPLCTSANLRPRGGGELPGVPRSQSFSSHGFLYLHGPLFDLFESAAHQIIYAPSGGNLSKSFWE